VEKETWALNFFKPVDNSKNLIENNQFHRIGIFINTL